LTGLGAAIKRKTYSLSTMENGTQRKAEYFTLKIFAVHGCNFPNKLMIIYKKTRGGIFGAALQFEPFDLNFICTYLLDIPSFNYLDGQLLV
jgi:hypothetical protein